MGGLCDFGVTPVPIGLGFGFWTALGLELGIRGPDLGLGLDKMARKSLPSFAFHKCFRSYWSGSAGHCHRQGPPGEKPAQPRS